MHTNANSTTPISEPQPQAVGISSSLRVDCSGPCAAWKSSRLGLYLRKRIGHSEWWGNSSRIVPATKHQTRSTLKQKCLQTRLAARCPKNKSLCVCVSDWSCYHNKCYSHLFAYLGFWGQGGVWSNSWEQISPGLPLSLSLSCAPSPMFALSAWSSIWRIRCIQESLHFDGL